MNAYRRDTFRMIRPIIAALAAVLLTLAAAPRPAWSLARKLVLVPTPIAGERRVALVIGNGQYSGEGVHPLKNPENDAEDMARTLQKLGFTVTRLLDADRDTLRDTVHAFADNVAKDGPHTVALLYYSGHGMQVNGSNYLIPTSFTALPILRDIDDYAYPVNKALDEMQGAGARVNIVVLDACRDNPYDTSRGVGGKGLAKMEAQGVYIAYATAEGQTADDNPSASNGLYTRELLKALTTKGLDIHQIFQKARRGVVAASQGAQYPYDYDGLLSDDFYFAGHLMTPPAPAPPGPNPGPTRTPVPPIMPMILNKQDANTVLLNAVTPDDARRALDAGADLNAEAAFGRTALMNAAISGRADVAKLLIDRGADLNATGGIDGDSALTLAASSGHADIVKMLIDHGVDINAKLGAFNSSTALMKAALRGHGDVVQLLIDHHADVNARSGDGNTALMGAAEFGYADVAKLLIDHGAHVNDQNIAGWTALKWSEASDNQVTEKVSPDDRAKTIAVLKAAGATE